MRTIRQRILDVIYPGIMKISQKLGVFDKIGLNSNSKKPFEDFFSLQVINNRNEVINFSELKGKKFLIVNTASSCAYTHQYKELQQLYAAYGDKLHILAFPSNDFKEQERKSDADINKFCTINFGVSFPLMRKSVVVKSGQQNEVFKWLTISAKNGWNDNQPQWNFTKYLIDEEGTLLGFFGPAISPLNSVIVDLITNTTNEQKTNS